ncbi:MAG: hypothetical protein NT154_10280, partial [Verrucomicrobia bacterium]|nr:hypothetical protein [Verrucomicrobiota bacterium]
QVLAMTNHAPNGSAQSFFNYVYDSRGNRTSMTTADGVTAYQYDALSQLIGVTYPGGRNVTYAYDAAGNRTVVTENGVPTAYTANALNQYSQAGAASFTYDADGNMTSRGDPTGPTTFEYDPENRLIQISTPTNGVWQYTYDALGNRTVVAHDGVATSYLHDPIGLVDVAAEYDNGGNLVARYNHALGLVARVDAATSSAYYAFDAIGNTRQISTSDGSMLNSYVYDSFGDSVIELERVPNPFRYLGRFGLLYAEGPRVFTRLRVYDAQLGRFLTEDPLFFAGRDFNLYRYCLNSPVLLIDPTGEAWKYYQGDVHYSQEKSWSFGYFTGSSLGFSLEVGYGAGVGLAFSLGPSLTVVGVNEGPASLSLPDMPYAGAGLQASFGYNFGTSIGLSYGWMEGYFKGWIWIPDENMIPLGTAGTTIVRPVDPNDKIGPTGVGPDRLISAQDEMEYMIRFENHPTATAPVQELVVVDYLDPNLDWSTVEFGEIRYGDRVITVPAGQLIFSARDLPPTNSITITGITLGQMAVDMTATFNSQNGRLEWRLLAKDTQDNQFPDDALAGFLPPNNTNTHCGEGHLTFRVKPKLGLEIGTRIENKASIVFDLNDPIETPAVTNTIGQVEPKLGASIAYPASQMSLGLPFTLSLTVSNSGINVATNIVVTNAIPAGFAFVNATGTVGTVTYTNGNVVWTIGTLSNGVPVTLTLTLLPTQGGNFVAPIRIRGGNGLVVDLDPLFTVQPPMIGIGTVTGGLVEVFAPSVATSYLFEVSHDLLGSPPGWQPLTNVPAVIGDRQVISITPTNSAFFRLRKP